MSKKKKDNNQTAIKKVQEGDHGSLDYDDRDGKGQKWSDPRYILKVDPSGFVVDWIWIVREREKIKVWIVVHTC